MASRRPRSRRFLLPTVLAAVLVGEITGIALAHPFALPAPAAPRQATVSGIAPEAAGAVGAVRLADPSRGALAVDPIAVEVPNRARGTAAARGFDLAEVRRAVGTVRTNAAATTSSSGSGHRAGSPFAGRNHVWIPSLGIDKVVQSFPCSRSRPPDAGVYRWGCAGRNNVYLLSHAWSTFKPLHDAYVSGRLHAGMTVVYGDGAGTVHTYSVAWWRVVAPTAAASWAWASLGRPSMTLQTCVGANSAYRLMVRLVRTA